MNEETCCPKFDPIPWDGTTIEWTNKKFIKDKVFTLFYIPMNFGAVIKRMDEKVRNSGGKILDCLCLSDHTSKWNMDIYLAIDEEIPGEDNATLTGEFFSKVYEGPFKDTGKWCEDFKSIVKSKNKSVEKLYMWYTTCPKCAKKYGKNYVVILGKMN